MTLPSHAGREAVDPENGELVLSKAAAKKTPPGKKGGKKESEEVIEGEVAD